MKKTRLLILGYSSFLRRRVIPAIRKIKNLEYSVCSKSNKINLKEKILFNDYNEALLRTDSKIVYISLINSLHFKYAKKALEKGFNVIVDKPITTSFYQTKKLLNIARKKKLLLAEATLYNFHEVFNKMLKACNGVDNILHIQAYFNIKVKKKLKEIIKIKADCEQDMGPYAASIIRLFMNNKIENLEIIKNYYKKTKIVKEFYVTNKYKGCTFFGSFAFNREVYMNEIKFFTKNKIVSSPHRIFAPNPNNDVFFSVSENDKIKKIKTKKDDCVLNFFNKVIHNIKNKNFNYFYDNILIDATIRKKMS